MTARSKPNRNWEAHNELIKETMRQGLDKRPPKVPTIPEIAKATGLSARTIARHIASLKDEPSRFERYRALTPLVVEGMAKAAARGDARAAKLHYQFVEGWIPQTAVNVAQQNPYSDLDDSELEKKLSEHGQSKPEDAEPPGED